MPNEILDKFAMDVMTDVVDSTAFHTLAHQLWVEEHPDHPNPQDFEENSAEYGYWYEFLTMVANQILLRAALQLRHFPGPRS
jgi:hypothetical protein